MLLEIFPCFFVILLPGKIPVASPDHPDPVKLLYPLCAKHTVFLSGTNFPLRQKPPAKPIPFLRLIPYRHLQIPVLLIIPVRVLIHSIPGSSQCLIQSLKQYAAVPHLIDYFEVFMDNLFLPSHEMIIGRSNLHLFLNCSNAVQVLYVQHDIEDDCIPLLTCRQCTSDLLFINDRRHRRPEQNHTVHILHMYSLVQHIDTIQQLQMPALIRFKICKCPTC